MVINHRSMSVQAPPSPLVCSRSAVMLGIGQLGATCGDAIVSRDSFLGSILLLFLLSPPTFFGVLTFSQWGISA